MKRAPRRQLMLALAALLLTAHLPAQADEQMDAIHKRGRLKVAVYNNFPPYSDAGKGIDVELGQALAAKMGLQAEIIGFLAGEDMGDVPPPSVELLPTVMVVFSRAARSLAVKAFRKPAMPLYAL